MFESLAVFTVSAGRYSFWELMLCRGPYRDEPAVCVEITTFEAFAAVDLTDARKGREANVARPLRENGGIP